jgi:hypothetical protein
MTDERSLKVMVLDALPHGWQRGKTAAMIWEELGVGARSTVQGLLRELERSGLVERTWTLYEGTRWRRIPQWHGYTVRERSFDALGKKASEGG